MLAIVGEVVLRHIGQIVARFAQRAFAEVALAVVLLIKRGGLVGEDGEEGLRLAVEEAEAGGHAHAIGLARQDSGKALVEDQGIALIVLVGGRCGLWCRCGYRRWCRCGLGEGRRLITAGREEAEGKGYAVDAVVHSRRVSKGRGGRKARQPRVWYCLAFAYRGITSVP